MTRKPTTPEMIRLPLGIPRPLTGWEKFKQHIRKWWRQGWFDGCFPGRRKSK